MRILILILLIQCLSIKAFSQSENELEGICAQKNTAASCTVINNTGMDIFQIGWLLEGSWVDYGDDIRVDIKTGETGVVSNTEFEDNCLFTEWTWVQAYARDTETEKDIVLEDNRVTLSFDEEENCTVEFK